MACCTVLGVLALHVAQTVLILVRTTFGVHWDTKLDMPDLCGTVCSLVAELFYVVQCTSVMTCSNLT